MAPKSDLVLVLQRIRTNKQKPVFAKLLLTVVEADKLQHEVGKLETQGSKGCLRADTLETRKEVKVMLSPEVKGEKKPTSVSEAAVAPQTGAFCFSLDFNE